MATGELTQIKVSMQAIAEEAAPSTVAMIGETYLERFGFIYSYVHVFLASTLCLLGIISKIIIIRDLRSKNMSTPTNLILTWLAISNGLLMAAYLPTVILKYHTFKASLPFHSGQAGYVMLLTLVKVLHSISVWLMVILTVYRYLVVVYSRHGRQMCHLYRVKVTLVVVCSVVPLIVLPGAFCFSFQGMQKSNQTWWLVEPRKDLCHHPIYDYVRVGVNTLFVTAIPCFILTSLTALLIRKMKNERNRTRLFYRRHFQLDEKLRGTRQMTNRTRAMLISVVLLFLLSEIPRGILHVLDEIKEDFNTTVPFPFADLFDILSLFSRNITFVLFCTMSKRFRDTFKTKFVNCKFKVICHILPFFKHGMRHV